MAQRIIPDDKSHQTDVKLRLKKAPITIPVLLVRGMLAGVDARAESSHGYLRDAAIPADLLSHAGARVTAEQYIALCRTLIEQRADESLGYLARPLKPGSFALLARSALGARDLRQAIKRIAHTFSLLRDDEALELRVKDGLAGLVLHFNDTSAAQPLLLQTFRHTYFLRWFWRLMAWMAGGRLPAKRFDFAFGRPPDVGTYKQAFPATMQFDQARTAVWFDEARLQTPVRRDEVAWRALLAGMPGNIIIPPRNEDVVSKKVCNHLLRTRWQAGWASLAETAKALHMSTATLQRRLAQERTSFQALKDELRRDIAIERLNTSAVPLADLARELGFSESAAFQRAFKGWTGRSPGASRQAKA